MSENTPNEEVEETSGDEYVTKTELEGILDTKLESFVSRFLGDTVEVGSGEETEVFDEVTDQADDVLGHMSPSQVEQLMEKKVQEALASLGVKKQAAAPVKKSTGKKMAPVKKTAPPKAEPEEAPSVPGRMSIGQRLWGTK